MTKIRLLDKNVLSVTLFNAMCAQVEEDYILKHFNLEASGYDTVADLKILVNGVEVDLVPELTQFLQQVDDQFEKAILEEAKKLVMKDNVLRDLQMAIENAEWVITERLENLTKE